MSAKSTASNTQKEPTKMAEKKRVPGVVVALALFSGWMWHAAESAKPGFTQEETTKIADAGGGAAVGVLNSGRSVAQQAGLGNLLQPPAEAATPSQLGGVSGGR